jgi:hypothetical protein
VVDSATDNISAGRYSFEHDLIALSPLPSEWTWNDRSSPQSSGPQRTPDGGTGQSVKRNANVQSDSAKDRSTDHSEAEFATDLIFPVT